MQMFFSMVSLIPFGYSLEKRKAKSRLSSLAFQAGTDKNISLLKSVRQRLKPIFTSWTNIFGQHFFVSLSTVTPNSKAIRSFDKISNLRAKSDKYHLSPDTHSNKADTKCASKLPLNLLGMRFVLN